MSVLEVFAILRAGGAVVVVDEQHRRDPDTWAELIEEHGVTFLNLMPGWLEMLLEVGGARLPTLRVVLLGGDWVRPELIRGLRKSVAGGAGAPASAVRPKPRCTARSARSTTRRRDWTSVPYGMPFPNNACRVVAADGIRLPGLGARRTVVLRARHRPRLPRPARPDRREVRRARRPNLVSDRRSRPLPARRRHWSSSAASITGSRSAATGSNSAKSRRRCSGCRASTRRSRPSSPASRTCWPRWSAPMTQASIRKPSPPRWPNSFPHT